MTARITLLTWFVLILFGFSPISVNAQQRQESDPSYLKGIEREIQNIYSSASQSIVRISSCQIVDKTTNDQCIRIGSGFAVDKNGFIVTTADIVENSDMLKVMSADNQEHKAQLIALDHTLNIAVLKIDKSKLPPLRMGNSRTVKPGSIIVGITNPCGMPNSLAVGFVSGHHRSGFRTGRIENYIQTTIPLNPGDTGSPLINSDGEIIGILTSVLIDDSSRQIQPNSSLFQLNSVSLAIPINVVKKNLPQMIQNGKIEHSWLGIEVQNLTSPNLIKFNFKVIPHINGIIITQIFPNSPADIAGLQQGDIITNFGQDSISNINDLQMRVAETTVDTQINMTIIRNYQKITVPIRTQKVPEQFANSNQ